MSEKTQDVEGFDPDEWLKDKRDLIKAVKHIESRGRRYDKNGNLLTSSAGAQGEMQVMPGTAKSPGFGVRPAQDNSPDELARVGEDYLLALDRRYGNREHALAAYNWGPDRVDKWISKGADVSRLPAETQNYLAQAKNLLGNVDALPPTSAGKEVSVEGFDPDAFLAYHRAKQQGQKQEQQFTPIQPLKPDTGNFMRGIKNWAPQYQETWGSAKTLVGSALQQAGAKDIGESILQSGLKSREEGQAATDTRETDEFTDAWEKGIGSVVTEWLPYQIGSGVANVAETIATGGLGVVMKWAAKKLINKGAKEVAEKIYKERGAKAAEEYIRKQAKEEISGFSLGMGAQAALHGAGEVTSRALEEGEKRGEDPRNLDLARVGSMALIHGVSDFFVNKIGLDALKIGEKSTSNLVLDIVKKIGITGAKQIPAEELQTMAERYGAKLSLTDAEALKEYINTAAAAFGMSVGPGAVGGVRTRLSAPREFSEEEKKLIEQQGGSSNLLTKEGRQQIAPPLNPEAASVLMPAVDESNIPLTTTDEETAAANAKFQAEAGERAAKEAADRKAGEAEAEDLIRKFDAGEDINYKTFRAAAKKFGLTIPFNLNKQDGVNYVRRALFGEQNVAGTDQQGTGTSAGVVDGPGVNVPTGESEEAVAGGVDTTTAGAKQPTGGTGKQPTALNAGLQTGENLGTQTSQAQQTKTQGQAQPATAEQLNKLKELRDRLEDFYNVDATAEDKMVKTHMAELNKLEQELGIKNISTFDKPSDEVPPGSTFSQKAYKYNKGLSPKENLEKAFRQQQLAEQLERDRRETAIEDARAKKTYDTEATVNVDNIKDKERRKALKEEENRRARERRVIYEQVKKERDQEQENLEAALNNINEEIEQLEKQYPDMDRNSDVETRIQKLEEKAAEIDNILKEDYPYALPAWENLEQGPFFAAAKEFIGGPNSQRQTLYSYRVAAQLLVDKYKNTRDRSLERENKRERIAALDYDQARRLYGKQFGLNFPVWNKLDEAAKEIYLAEIGNRSEPLEEKAFRKLAEYLRADKATRETIARAKHPGRQAGTQVTTEIGDDGKTRKATVTPITEREDLKKLREDYASSVPEFSTLGRLGASNRTTNSLSNSVINYLQKGNLKSAIIELKNQLSSRPDQRSKLAASLLGLIDKLNLKTKVVISDKRLKDRDLGQYDSGTDTITLDGTEGRGLNITTFMHELIHAASAQVLFKFADPKTRGQLSTIQQAGAEQIFRIYHHTKSYLSHLFPNAYENVHEFLAYTLSDADLQRQLQGLSSLDKTTGKEFEKIREGVAKGGRGDVFGWQPDTPIPTLLPQDRTMWSAFKNAIADILGIPRGARKSYNYLMELNAAFENLLSEQAISDKPVGAVFSQKAAPTQPPSRAGGLFDKDLIDQYKEKSEKISNAKTKFWDRISTYEGWRETARKWVDRTFAVQYRYKQLEMAGKINHDPNGAFNDFGIKATTATGISRNYLMQMLHRPMESLRESIAELTRISGRSLNDDIMPMLHMLGEAYSEPERRHIKWLMSVPLKIDKVLKVNGVAISPAERRIQLVGDPRTGKEGLIHKVELTAAQQKQVRNELESLAKKYADAMGDSPRIKSERMRAKALSARQKANQLGVMSIDENSNEYNALGIEPSEAALRLKQLETLPKDQQKLIANIFEHVKEITNATKELNKLGNYWSYPVSNLVGIYGWQHYMPFKGVKHSIADTILEPERTGTKSSRLLQQQEHAAHGRFSVSDNPILQAMSDAFRAAGRAGRADFMQSILNAVKQDPKNNPNGTGIIDGEVVQRVPFNERETTDLEKYQGGDYIFVYSPDGSISIIKIKDPELARGFRYHYRENSYMVDLANKVTSAVGSMHTRWNFNFAPKNFVSDTLQNAWNIGAGRLGPLKGAKYLAEIANSVTRNGLGKAMEVAALYEKSDENSQMRLAALAAKDPFIRDMLEMLKYGGKTAYLQSFSLKNGLQELEKQVGKSRIAKTKESIDAVADIWNSMFEFTSRVAAYQLFKQEFLKQEIKKGVSNKREREGLGYRLSPAERAAAERAAAETKNLTNFELVGENSHYMSAVFMFFRASAVSSMRTIEALAPAFPGSLERAEARLPANIRNDEKALNNFRAEYKKLQTNARIMSGALIGLGYATYMLSMLTAPDDDWGENTVKNDNMDQWERYARFHLPNGVSRAMGLGEDVVFQIPWGFGLGALASMGAQIAGMVHGQQSIKDGMSNIVAGALADSFVPLPISKISWSEKPLQAALDTITPSVVRPYVEFLMNTDGVGRGINSAMKRRMGDAFTGSDRVPQVYKDLAVNMFDVSDGFFNWSPNSIYFFANSYIDGVARLGEIVNSWAYIAQDEKNFHPKTDLALMGSFFGAKNNVDAREYSKIENKIKEARIRMDALDEQNPEGAARYDLDNPLMRGLVDEYKAHQGKLNELRAEANKIRADRLYTPQNKEDLLKVITMEQNVIKHLFILNAKASGLSP